MVGAKGKALLFSNKYSGASLMMGSVCHGPSVRPGGERMEELTCAFEFRSLFFRVRFGDSIAHGQRVNQSKPFLTAVNQSCGFRGARANQEVGMTAFHLVKSR